MQSSKRNMASVDVMKFICALLVVGIHTEPFASVYILDKLFGVVSRIAVPFFFVSSAFFYFKKPITWQGYVSFVKRLGSLYLSWVVIYLVIGLLRGAEWNFDRIFFAVFVYGYSHFWYLVALMVSVGICSAAIKLIKNKLVVFVAAMLLYIWGTLCSTYNTVIPVSDPIIHLIGVRNGIHYGPIFVMIGFFLVQLRPADMPKPKVTLLFSLLGFAILGLEGILGTIVLNAESTILWITTPFVAFFVCAFVFAVDVPISEKTAGFLRKLSVGIYCVHPVAVNVLRANGIDGVVLFLMSSLLSSVITVILMEIAKNEKCRFARNLL